MTGLISIAAGTLHLPAAAVTFRPEPIDIAAAGALILVSATLVVTGLWRGAGAGRRRRGQERAALRALDEELDALLADVRQAMNQRDKIDLTSAESCGPPNTAPVSRLLDERMPAENISVERSFDRYRGALPRRAPLLDLLAEFRRADRAFRVAAMRLDRRLADVIGGHNAVRLRTWHWRWASTRHRYLLARPGQNHHVPMWTTSSRGRLPRLSDGDGVSGSG